MKYRPLPILLLSALIALCARNVIAQSPAFTYQGSLSENGLPANSTNDLTFTLYGAASGGAAVGTSNVVNDLVISNGLFTVPLDFGAAVFNGSDRWLEIAVRPGASTSGYTPLNPRQRITATPYALYAPSAGTAANAASVAAANITGTIAPANVAAGSITTVMLANGAVGSNELADGAVTARKVATQHASVLSTTFTNPTPANGEWFGNAVAAVGTDRLLIGAFYDGTDTQPVGAAYLFSTNGTLLTTFNNPAPAINDYFGWSVAAVGTDRLLIGAFYGDAGVANAGVAYLFRTNGTLAATFINPTPEADDYFGYSVAAVGTNRVLIGASRDGIGADAAGVAYLFSLSGTLLTTFTNPVPVVGGSFGHSMAAVGSGRVLIGATGDDGSGTYAGAAYLFSTNGTLLTTFTNPAPAINDGFGVSVAAVGSDRVLIGAIGGVDAAGAAYLFSTNGTLLTTFPNPTPASGDAFGISVAAMGSDRVLIGADSDNAGAADAGAAHLFTTNGTLLATITKPTPVSSDWFGRSVTAVGSDRVLIGATGDDTGATSAGAAYLLSIESYTPGLIAEGVRAGAITTASLANGAVTAGKIGGVLLSSQIPILDAATKLTGTLPDARLSPNVALLNRTNVFTGTNRFANVLLATNANNQFAGVFTGHGAGLTGLDAASLASGTVADPRLSANVALLNGTNIFTGTNQFANVLLATDANNQIAGVFTGNGAGLTNLNAASIANVALLNGTNVFTGTNRFAGVVRATNANNQVAGAFTGNGAGLTNLNAATLVSGSVADARLSPNVALLNRSVQSFIGDTNTFSGYVGIGTSNPSNRLTVRTSANSYGIEHTDGTVCLATYVGGSAGGGWLGTMSPHKLNFFTASGSATMTVSTNGNVGIGTNSPQADLHVVGDILASGTFTGNGAGLTNLQPTSLTGTLPDARLSTNASLLGATIEATEVNATTFNTTFWRAVGNAGTTPGTHFLGTTDNQSLDFRVNNQRALRLVPDATSPSLIGGFSGNSVGTGASGSVIAGGGLSANPNTIGINSPYSAIGGGVHNNIASNSLAATIAGGDGNNIGVNSDYSAIGDGYDNNIADFALYAVIPGGGGNAVGPVGHYAFAAGHRAKANHPGTFVWADSTGFDFASTDENQFLIRAAGGVGIGTTNPSSTLHLKQAVDANSGGGLRLESAATSASWLIGVWSDNDLAFRHSSGAAFFYIRDTDGTQAIASDRRLKKDIEPLAPMLDRLLALKPVSFRYKPAPESTPPTLGFVAQEVETVLPDLVDQKGEHKMLVMSGLIPVTVAAVQELNRKLDERSTTLDARTRKLETENATLQQSLAELKALVLKLSAAQPGQ